MSGVKPTNERPPRRLRTVDEVDSVDDGLQQDWEPDATDGIPPGSDPGDVLTWDGDSWEPEPPTASSLTIKDEGTPLATDATSIDFVGPGVTATGATGAKTVTIPGNPLTVKDEGTPLATDATSLDFVGAGVTASGTGAGKTITIPGGTTMPWFIVTAAAYGATGNGTTDDTTAINLAIAALNAATRGVLYFPAGTYKVTGALTAITATCTILGDGIEASKVAFTSATAVLFTLTGAGIIVRGLWLNNSATTTAGAAIRVSSGGNLNRYENVLFHGFWIGLDIQSGAEWVARGLYMESVNKYGVKVSGTDPDWGITDSTFSTASSADAAIRIQSTSDGGGARITGCKINGDTTNGFNYGVDLAAQTGTNTVILLVANCSIENTRSHGINGTTSAATSKWGAISIVNCEIAPFASNTAKAISLVGTTAADLYDITIVGCTFRTSGTARSAIQFTNVNNAVISAIVLNGFNAVYSQTTSTLIKDLTTAGSGTTVATDVIWDAAGDLAVGTGADTAAKLAKGNAGAVLAMGNGAVIWNAGTSFPASKATNDRYYRTDLNAEFYWDGTRWLSTELFRESFGVGNVLPPDTIATSIGRMTQWATDFDLWLEHWSISTYIASTNDGSHFWTVQLNKYIANDSRTTIDSFTTAGDTVNAWTKRRRAIGAVYAAATYFGMSIDTALTSTPGGMYFTNIALEYRLIAT